MKQYVIDKIILAERVGGGGVGVGVGEGGIGGGGLIVALIVEIAQKNVTRETRWRHLLPAGADDV